MLVGLIVVLSAVILALAGITFFLTEHLQVVSLRQNQAKAIDLAQAGAMTALYDFRRNIDITLGEQTVEAGPAAGASDDNVFILQAIDSGTTQADVLLMSMRGVITFPRTPALCGGPKDRIAGWIVRNVLAVGGSSLVIASFKVDWSPAAGEGILQLQTPTFIWSAAGCVPAARNTDISLAGVPVAQRTLTPGTRWATNRIWFTSTAMDGKDWIDATFTMADGSSRTSRWDRLIVANRSADVTIKSVGEVRKGFFPFIVWRRLQADYRICGSVSGTSCDAEAEERTQPGNLIGYQELTTLTP